MNFPARPCRSLRITAGPRVRRASRERASTCSIPRARSERKSRRRRKAFLTFEQIATDPQQLRLDYERLRITWELTRDIGLERDFDKLLEKILQALFRFVKADRGVILLKDDAR